MTALVLTPNPSDLMGISEAITNTSNLNLPGEGVAIAEPQVVPGIGFTMTFNDPMGIVENPPQRTITVAPATFTRTPTETMRMGDNGHLLGIMDNYNEPVNISESPTFVLAAKQIFNDPMGIVEPAPTFITNLSYVFRDPMGIVEPTPSLTITRTGIFGDTAPTALGVLTASVTQIPDIDVIAASTLTVFGTIAGQGFSQPTAAGVLTAKVTRAAPASLTAASTLVALGSVLSTHIIQTFPDAMGISENSPQPLFAPRNFTRSATDVMGIIEGFQLLVNSDPSQFISNVSILTSGDFVQSSFALYHNNVWIYPVVYILVQGTWIQIQ